MDRDYGRCHGINQELIQLDTLPFGTSKKYARAPAALGQVYSLEFYGTILLHVHLVILPGLLLPCSNSYLQ